MSDSLIRPHHRCCLAWWILIRCPMLQPALGSPLHRTHVTPCPPTSVWIQKRAARQGIQVHESRTNSSPAKPDADG